MCGKEAGYSSGLRSHLELVHLSAPTHECDTCGKIFNRKISWDKHIANVHKSMKDHVCDICHMKFFTMYYLKRHFKINHVENDTIFKCEMCPKEFKNERSRKDHVAKIHLLNKIFNERRDANQFKCETCQKILSSNESLRSHIKNVHEQKRRTKHCQLCDKDLNHESFKKHQKTVHEKLKEFK